MSNISNFPSRKDQRLEHAGDWIAAIGRGITEEEEQELGAWLVRDKANYDLFMELAELWDDMDALDRQVRQIRRLALPDRAQRCIHLPLSVEQASSARARCRGESRADGSQRSGIQGD